MILEHEKVSCVEIGDTFTHPDHQRKGIFISLLKLSDQSARENCKDFIYGMPNDLALPGYINRYNYIQAPFTLVNMLKVLDASKLLNIPMAGTVYNAVSKLVWRSGAGEKKYSSLGASLDWNWSIIMNIKCGHRYS